MLTPQTREAQQQIQSRYYGYVSIKKVSEVSDKFGGRQVPYLAEGGRLMGGRAGIDARVHPEGCPWDKPGDPRGSADTERRAWPGPEETLESMPPSTSESGQHRRFPSANPGPWEAGLSNACGDEGSMPGSVSAMGRRSEVGTPRRAAASMSTCPACPNLGSGGPEASVLFPGTRGANLKAESAGRWGKARVLSAGHVGDV